MRIISKKTLDEYGLRFPDAKGQPSAWHYDAKRATWKKPIDINRTYRNASILSAKRVVFNIKGNRYRLIVIVEYEIERVYIRWFGPHSEYDKIDATRI
jgi:mRNA interferase HigB